MRAIVLAACLYFVAALASLPEGLTRRIRDGDRDAFRSLFDLLHEPLFFFLRKKGCPDGTVDDIVQQAFVAVWENRASLDPGQSLKSYLYTIALNRARNHWRDTNRMQLLDAEVVDSQHTPDRRADADSIQRTFDEAVEALPERRRMVFELCFKQGLTYKETAAVMDITRKTVENQMARALKHMRAALEPFVSDDTSA